MRLERPTPAPQPSKMGHSVGRWKAETLVVDTIPITDPTVFAEPVPLNVQSLIESGD